MFLYTKSTMYCAHQQNKNDDLNYSCKKKKNDHKNVYFNLYGHKLKWNYCGQHFFFVQIEFTKTKII